MTKGQKIGWGIGVGVFLLIVVVLIVMNKDKISGAIGGIFANQPISPTYPAYCDKERFGYDIYGNANSNCGVIASEPYSADCDPDRPGYDLNGFANPDCGFGRKSNVRTQQNGATSQKSGLIWNFDSITSTPNGSILNGTSTVPIQLRVEGSYMNIIFTFSDGNRASFKRKFLTSVSPTKILVSGLFPTPVGATIISRTATPSTFNVI